MFDPTQVLNQTLSLLPEYPDKDIWTDGEDIICKKEFQADAIADLIDAIFGDHVTATGYYDPKEDERNGEITECTGWYYVTVL